MLAVAVVVSHLNSARTLDRCLSAIEAQDYPCEIVVVDGGSTDGSTEIARRHRVRLIVSDGCSEAEGQNLGIRDTSADVICMTNSDCYTPKDWVRRHVAWHERGFDMVGGKLVWGGDDYSWAWNYYISGGPTDILTSGLSLGFSNSSFTRALYDRIGGLKEMPNQQDMDFWIRAEKAKGRLVLDPKAEVYHDHPLKSLHQSFNRSYAYGWNHIVLLKTAYGSKPWPHYRSWPYSLWLLEEFLLVKGVRVWKQYGRRGFLPKFLFLRLLGHQIPSLLAWVVSLLFGIRMIQMHTHAKRPA